MKKFLKSIFLSKRGFFLFLNVVILEAWSIRLLLNSQSPSITEVIVLTVLIVSSLTILGLIDFEKIKVGLNYGNNKND